MMFVDDYEDACWWLICIYILMVNSYMQNGMT